MTDDKPPPAGAPGITLSRETLSVRHVAHRENNRCALAGVHVAADGSTVATDGTALARVSALPDEKPTRSVTVMTSAVNAILKLLGRGKNERPFTLNGDGLTATRGGESLPLAEAPGTFPPWEHVIPTDEPTLILGLDLARVANLAKVAADFGCTTCRVEIHATEETEETGETEKARRYVVRKPVVFKATRESEAGRELTMILAPLNLD